MFTVAKSLSKSFRIADATSPEDRMQEVVKWYLTSIHVGRNGSVAKKPYNPIIGEVFHCSWRIPRNPDINSVSLYTNREYVTLFEGDCR